jgi:hypothetical protein
MQLQAQTTSTHSEHITFGTQLEIIKCICQISLPNLHHYLAIAYFQTYCNTMHLTFSRFLSTREMSAQTNYIKDAFWDYVPCSTNVSENVSSPSSVFLRMISFHSYINVETLLLSLSTEGFSTVMHCGNLSPKGTLKMETMRSSIPRFELALHSTKYQKAP